MEILLSGVSQKGYFNSFYFWMDVVSTLSLLFDVGWISNSLFSLTSNYYRFDTLDIARAAKASTIGKRAVRTIRLISLIRLIRILKFYKMKKRNV